MGRQPVVGWWCDRKPANLIGQDCPRRKPHTQTHGKKAPFTCTTMWSAYYGRQSLLANGFNTNQRRPTCRAPTHSFRQQPQGQGLPTSIFLLSLFRSATHKWMRLGKRKQLASSRDRPSVHLLRSIVLPIWCQQQLWPGSYLSLLNRKIQRRGHE